MGPRFFSALLAVFVATVSVQADEARTADDDEASAVWTVLQPHRFTSSGGATLTRLPDGSIRATGTNVTGDTYVFKAHTALKGITAIRLEALPDAASPQRGPGRAENGNFMVVEFKVSAGPRNEPAKSAAVAFKNAVADYAQPHWGGVAGALDNNPKTGWCIDPAHGQKHAAVFALKTPLDHADGTTLAITLEHTADHKFHNLGRFRLSATTIQAPFPLEHLDLTRARLDEVWASLASANATQAGKAADDLIATGRAVSLLKKRLKAEVIANDQQIAQLIKDLDDDLPKTRENAMHHLAKAGAAAAPAAAAHPRRGAVAGSAASRGASAGPSEGLGGAGAAEARRGHPRARRLTRGECVAGRHGDGPQGRRTHPGGEDRHRETRRQDAVRISGCAASGRPYRDRFP